MNPGIFNMRTVLRGTVACAAAGLLGACLTNDNDGASGGGTLDGAWLYVEESTTIIDAGGDTLDTDTEIHDTISVFDLHFVVIGGGTLTEIGPTSQATFSSFVQANDSQWVLSNLGMYDTIHVRHDGELLEWSLEGEQSFYSDDDSVETLRVVIRATLEPYDGPVPPALWSQDPATVGNEPDDDSASATTLTADGRAHYGYLMPADLDGYRVSVDSGTVLALLTQGPTDTYLSLYDAAGDLVAENDDAPWASGWNAGIDHAFEASGTFYVMVEGYNELEEGYYSLTANVVDSVRNEETWWENEGIQDDEGAILGKRANVKGVRSFGLPLTRALRP